MQVWIVEATTSEGKKAWARVFEGEIAAKDYAAKAAADQPHHQIHCWDL